MIDQADRRAIGTVLVLSFMAVFAILLFSVAGALAVRLFFALSGV